MLMGIINITPDSFYDGGKINNIDTAITQINSFVEQEVDIIDLGGYSSRPGAKNISIKEEEKRIIPIIEKAIELYPKVVFSIDTFRHQIAKKAIELGVSIINDIYFNYGTKEMTELLTKNNVSYILMHMRGKPSTMQKKIYYKDFYHEILLFFEKQINMLNKKGIENIILDPGFGFGKTLNQNYQLINMIPKIKEFGYPVLCGISRKSMISKVLNTSPNKSLTGTIAANTICLMKGANIIRVHDTIEAKETIDIVKMTQSNL
ncbi:MAG: dihydropteroate synthase [Flavobacteriales bacterium]|nr:dihydropteroate synthase [Flavobacteriales bacterium]